MDRSDRIFWIDVGAAADLGAPERVEVDGTPVVVAKVGDRVLAAVDRCPHRGAPLSAGTVVDGCLVCPYHGWAFDAEGHVAAIPALGPDATLPKRARLRTATTAVDGDRVVLDPGSVPAVDPPGRAMGNGDAELGAGWHPVCRSEEVAPGEAADLDLLGRAWTVERNSGGELACADAHGVADHLGHIWLAPQAPRVGLLDIPEFDEDDWHLVPMPRVEGRYGVGLLLDNQIDAGHFSFVHRATFGSDAEAALPAYEVVRDDGGFEVRLRVPIAARNDVGPASGARPLVQHRTMTYRYRAPSTLFLRLDYEEMGGSTGILFCFTPLGRDRARMDVDLLFRHPDGFTEQQLAERLAFEIAVVGEDLALQDRFDRIELPLDITAEIHTRADRAAVEVRRILAELYAS